MAQITVKRKLKSGKTITYRTKDRGKPRKTPEREKWYTPGTPMGWRKDQPAAIRRRLALKAHSGDKLAAGRSLQALSNVSTDSATKKLSRQDALYFFDLHKKGK